MESEFIKELPGILAITFMFGGAALYGIVHAVSDNWRKARVAEQNAVLKKAMIDRGFTADEIVRVLNHESSGADRMAACHPREPARTA